MSRCLLVCLVGGVLLCVPAAADAAPADVTVRVEGVASTLVPRTAIHTTAATVNKDGAAGHDCTGTSAAGALEQATGGDWNGSWFDPFGYAVERIRTESHVFPDPDFYALWINNRGSSTGICQTELQQGDEVLFFVDRCVFNDVTFECDNPPVLPLGLTAPRTAPLGTPFNVQVVEYASDGTPSPTAGATVAGGHDVTTTDAAGNATVTFATGGEHTLRATKPNRAASATEPVCATNGSDGLCDTVAARDVTPPSISILGPVDNKRYARKQAPRRLRARIAPDPSGLLAVKLRLTRNAGHGRCTYFSGTSERFRRGRLIKGSRCGATHGHWFGVGDRENVDYLLPKRLPRGRYVLDVNAIDKAYNRADKRKRGKNRIVFYVR